MYTKKLKRMLNVSLQKYIVWPTPKPKTEFHKALETAFPVYDPLFPKVKLLKESQVQELSSKNERDEEEAINQEENVPESWDRLDDGSVEAKETPEITSDQSAAATATAEEKDDIVLGPGGQWGLMPERGRLGPATGFIRPVVTKKEEDPLAPKVAPWSLPSPGQHWEFSELTNHGRKKQKALQRRNRKKAAETTGDI